MPTDIRVLNGNIGPRWSYSRAKIKPASRKAPLLDGLLHGPQAAPWDNPPGILILQECVREAQVWLQAKLNYAGYGNGVSPRTGLDRDRSGDNGVILYNPGDYTEDGTRICWVGHGPTKTFARALKLVRKGTDDWLWVIVTHPPNGVVTETFRMKQVRWMASWFRRNGVDLSRAVWGADWNSSKMYPERGVRSLLRKEFGLNDIETVLSADAFTGNSTNSHHGFSATRHDGKKLDAIVVGSRVRARAGAIVRTDEPPFRWSCDHNMVLGHLTIGD